MSIAAPAEHTVPDRLTLADYAEILSAGTEAAQHVNAREELTLAAYAARRLFNWGVLVDDDARQVVVHLMMRGHPRVVAMRAAIQVETKSITVIPPAEGWF